MEERSREYWQERFRQLEETQNDTSVQTMQEIEIQFRRAERALDEKINAWYQRFSANNEISMTEARRLLNSDELEEFHWDVEDYIKYGTENAIDERWMKQLENASAKVHISRLEALKVQTQQEMEKLFGNYSDTVDKHISDIYTSAYYHTAFEVQHGIGVGWDMQKLSEEKVSDIIHRPWAADGRNFSERIWTSKTQLINNLHNSLTRMCITGEAPDRAIRELSKSMGVSRSQAANIIQTESAAFSAKAQENCYSELDVEEFEVVETLDSHTCSTCGDMDGKHFPMKDYVIGVTVPPFHPRCRGCTCPYFDDEFTNGERIARGEDGKQYYVPEKMTFNEWKKTFVYNGYKTVDIKIPSDIMNISGMTPDYADAIERVYEKMKKEYTVNFQKVTVEDWGAEKPDVPFFCQYYEENGKHMAKLVVNSGYDFSGFDAIIKAGYEYKYFAGKNIDDYIEHEIVHIMTGQDAESAEAFNVFFEEVNGLYVPGVSGYSDEVKNGFETLAEAYIKIKNGEDVPEKAKEYVNRYIERWKRQ